MKRSRAIVYLVLLCSLGCRSGDSGGLGALKPGDAAAGSSATGQAGASQDGDGPGDGGAALEVPDGGEEPSGIEISEDFFEFDLSNNDRLFDHHGYYLAAGPTDFALAYQAHDPELDCLTRLDVTLIGSMSEKEQTRTVINQGPSQCSLTKYPAISVWRDNWRLVWTDNRSGSASLHHLDLASESEPAEITGSGQVEHSAQLISLNDRNMLAWITELESGERTISTSVVGLNVGAAQTVVGAGEGRRPDELALAPAAFMVAALGWMDLGEQNRGFYFQLLDEDGLPRTSPELVSRYSYSGGSLDIAGDERAGAMVYSISIDGSEQIRFRSFGLSGIKGDERKIVSPPHEATDASIAWFGGHGFLIAYRALSGPDIESPRIRLVAVDTGVNWETNRLQPIDVAEASADGGRTTIRIANDGTVMIAWLDAVSSNQKTLRAVRRR